MELNIEFILYVSDQKKSRDFYSFILDIVPSLDVDGMTEYKLSEGTKMGLMPAAGIKKILNGKVPDPENGHGIPRCELYISTNDAAAYCSRALSAGAIEISPLLKRNWGDNVAYYSDPDGHIIAFAE
jgi:catechol 2,3-dioxygenase-like lactoylglutathione lyase family enzyme